MRNAEWATGNGNGNTEARRHGGTEDFRLLGNGSSLCRTQLNRLLIAPVGEPTERRDAPSEMEQHPCTLFLNRI